MTKGAKLSLLSGVLALCVSSVAVPSASASEPDTLQLRQLIERNVKRGMTVHPSDFKKVEAIIRQPAQRRDRRGRWVSWYRLRLGKLGPAGRWAVARSLLLSPGSLEAARADQRKDLRIAMVAYLAGLRDAQLLGVLESLMVGRGYSQRERDLAAMGLARLAGLAGQGPLLRALSNDDRAIRLASLRGLRNVRTNVVVDAIAGLLDEGPDELVRVEAVRTLGYLGSTWAWKAASDEKHGEQGVRLRRRCARLILRFALDSTGRLQRRARLSLAMVVEPEDVGWLDGLAASMISTDPQRARWTQLRATLMRWWRRSERR